MRLYLFTFIWNGVLEERYIMSSSQREAIDIFMEKWGWFDELKIDIRLIIYTTKD